MADGVNGTPDAEQYDYLPKMLPYLDRHLIFPLLNDMDESLEVAKMKFELLKETNMTDYVADLDTQLRGLSERPKDYEEKREKVLEKRERLEDETEKLRSLLGDQDVINNLRNDKIANLNYLKESHGVTLDMVNALYDYGQFQYSCGAYQDAAVLLYQFRVLSTDNDKLASATWGKLASEILSTEWDSAMEEIQKVKENIDTRLFNNALAQLQHRTWLIHWSLFPFFNYDSARDTITELFFSPTYINTIQTLCPWILRYLTAAVITNRQRSRNSNAYQKQLKDLIRIVKQEGYEYSDPLTDFVRALYVDFDFEESRKKLELAEEILKRDFFLGSLSETFLSSARLLISETYCKIHARIDIEYAVSRLSQPSFDESAAKQLSWNTNQDTTVNSLPTHNCYRDLSSRLGLNKDEGEKWIVNLIRDTRVDAKIDYKEGTVIMNHPPVSVYQQVIERTKGGFFRTQVLNAAVAK